MGDKDGNQVEGEVMRQGHDESEFVKPKKRDLPYETMDDEGGEDAKVTRDREAQ